METTTTALEQMSRELIEQAVRTLSDVRAITDKAAALDRCRLADAEASEDPDETLERSASELGVYELWNLLDAAAGALAGHLGVDSDPVSAQVASERVDMARLTLATMGAPSPN